MLVSIPVFKKSSGRVFLLKSSLAFPAFREGVYSQPWSGPTRCCPRKTQGICKQGSVSSAPAGHRVPWEGHAPTWTGWQDDFWEAFASLSPAREGPGGFPSTTRLPRAGREGPGQSRSLFRSCCSAQQLDLERNSWAAVTASRAQLLWYGLSARGRDNDSFQG